MLTLDQLARRVRPDRTILMFGAGASIPSGAPSGLALANQLSTHLGLQPPSSDLAEVASIFENREGRPALINAIRDALKDLQPAGGLTIIPVFAWHSLYTTNYDQLVERAYAKDRKDLRVIRSNYDFTTTTRSVDIADAVPTLYKLHGCISQDVVDGHDSRMLITERDLEDFDNYRQALFRNLEFEMMTKDTLVIGQSLRDPHLRSLVTKVSQIHERQGTPGQIFVLSYSEDQDRALLLEQRGAQVAFGALDTFMQTLLEFSPAREPLVYTAETPVPGQLPIELRVATVDVAQAAGLSPNALRLFNGSAATYADIRGGLTIPRAVEGRLKNTLNERGKRVLVVTGVAGVGKSTLARRLLYSRMGGTSFCWEHQQTFPFDYEPWLRVEAVLRDQGLTGTLLIDDCVAHLAAVNRLADHLGDLERSSLKLIVTANSIQWQPRTKSPAFFRRGWTETLSRLLDADLEQLVNLIYQQPEIRVLVEQSFAQLPRAEQLDRLRDRCSAEMYVCLKNIFGSDRLDDILLREFAELDEAQRDVYRHVAALEAMGSRVHRQLIIRLLGLDAGTLKAQLTLLQGIVDEFDVKPRDGLYGWATRHAVIAETIATYKYADQGELDGLLERLIDGLNPAVWLEVDTARQICISDLGINRLSDRLEQLRLLRKLCDVVPGERIPRRRLVRKLLDLDLWDDAARAIANARRELGGDAVIDRYRVVLAIRRAQNTEGILDEDRLAMLQEATRLALACIVASPRDKHAYRVYGEVGVAIARMTKDTSVLDDAIGRIVAAEEDILDPQLAEYRRQFESTRRRLYMPSPVAAPVPVPGIGEADDA